MKSQDEETPLAAGGAALLAAGCLAPLGSAGAEVTCTPAKARPEISWEFAHDSSQAMACGVEQAILRPCPRAPQQPQHETIQARLPPRSEPCAC